MHTDVHPNITALVQLARGVGRHLGTPPDQLAVPWQTMIPDGLLASDTVWPVYPEIARALGVDGCLVWRTGDGALIGLDDFIERSVERYRIYDPAAIDPSGASGIPLAALEGS